jgi:hypothetical protein
VKRHIFQEKFSSLEGKRNNKGDWHTSLGEDRHASQEENSAFNIVLTSTTRRVVLQLLLAIQQDRGTEIEAFIHLQFGMISKTFLWRVFRIVGYFTIQHLPDTIC